MIDIRQPIFPSAITASTRSLFNSCPEKFFNAVLCGLVIRGAANVHLTCGAAYADALEAFRHEYFTTGNYERAVALGLLALIRTYGSFDPPEGETKTFDRTVATFVEYLYRYPPAGDHVKPIIGAFGPNVEFSFTFEIPGCFHPTTGDPMLYGGNLDQLVEFNDAVFVYDDKTTGSMGKLWKRQWDLRSQFSGYVVGLKASMPEIAARLAGVIVRGMGILKTEIKSEEVIALRPDWMLERWKRRLVWDTQRMIQCWKDNYWPTVGEENGECTSYGICPFHTLCTSQYPERYIEVEYEVVRQDPLTHERVENESAVQSPSS